jgi:hypothetical protein
MTHDRNGVTFMVVKSPIYRGRMEGLERAVQVSYDRSPRLKKLEQRVAQLEGLINECWTRGVQITKDALDEFREDLSNISPHQYPLFREPILLATEDLDAVFGSADRALAGVRAMIQTVEKLGGRPANLSDFEPAVAAVEELRRDYEELLVDIGDEKLHKMIEDRVQQVLDRPKVPTNWRQRYFGDNPKGD